MKGVAVRLRPFFVCGVTMGIPPQTSCPLEFLHVLGFDGAPRMFFQFGVVVPFIHLQPFLPEHHFLQKLVDEGEFGSIVAGYLVPHAFVTADIEGVSELFESFGNGTAAIESHVEEFDLLVGHENVFGAMTEQGGGR